MTEGYPTAAFASYSSGAITRGQFMRLLAAWQHTRGMDYTCRGARIGRFPSVTYRGVGAVIEDGELIFVNPSDGRLAMDRAGSLREFRRKVDIAKCLRNARNDGGAAWRR